MTGRLISLEESSEAKLDRYQVSKYIAKMGNKAEQMAGACETAIRGSNTRSNSTRDRNTKDASGGGFKDSVVRGSSVKRQQHSRP